MSRDKLTLSAEGRIIRAAKRLAKRNHSSVSAMFSRIVEQMDRLERTAPPALSPLTRKALGIAKSRSRKADRDQIADALADKYAR